jgi:hypothetical protein
LNIPLEATLFQPDLKKPKLPGDKKPGHSFGASDEKPRNGSEGCDMKGGITPPST